MWPFTKKEKLPETETVEEEPKQPLQLKFDPVATQRWLDSKKAEPEKKEPEPAPEVKLECPTCKQKLEKFSYRRFKCPQCRNWIYFKSGRLVTKEESEKIREEYYRQAKTVELAKIGMTEEMIQQREQELISKTGTTPNKYSVIQSLFNEITRKVKDLSEKEERYLMLAVILNRAGEESFHILRAAQKTRLAIHRKDGFRNVSIIARGECEVCTRLNGKVFSIKDSLRTMPLPIKECTEHPYNEDLSFCSCWYSSEYDDEYMEHLTGSKL